MKNSQLKDKILTAITFVIVAVLSVYIVIQLVAPDMTVKVFGFKPYIVVTESMEPVINVNDLVIVSNPKVDELEVGDIITFRADINYDGETEVVTHYIMSITQDGEDYRIRTRRYFADEADYSPDPWSLDQNSILGTYSFHIPWIGTIGQFAKSPFGIAAIVVNLGVIGGIVYLLKKAEPKKEATETETESS